MKPAPYTYEQFARAVQRSDHIKAALARLEASHASRDLLARARMVDLDINKLTPPHPKG